MGEWVTICDHVSEGAEGIMSYRQVLGGGGSKMQSFMSRSLLFVRCVQITEATRVIRTHGRI